MIDIIAGPKGRGKTKVLLQRVNEDIKTTHGTIVYLDKNSKHMFELSNQIRLIVVPEFDIIDTDMFIGFISGILSQDHDLDKIYLDSFLTIAVIKDNLLECIRTLDRISRKFEVDFIISASLAKEDLPEEIQSLVSVAL
ncbi:MAG: twitching motility protein PilT [Eubacterium sp.]|nr:twitching motility protein PilT [Eubacterium sp.]